MSGDRTGIDRNGDGFVDMSPDETRAQFERLHAAGADFRLAWARSIDRINSPGKVGNGRMGEAFMGNYRDNAAAVAKAAGEVAGIYQELANDGYYSVQIYQGAQTESIKQFPPA